MNKIIPLKAFRDNYIWALHSPDHSMLALVDPGDSTPALQYLKKYDLRLSAILITHHHQDHTGGIKELCKQYPNTIVYGPRNEVIPEITSPLHQGMSIILWGKEYFKIMEIPGHTLGHIAYYNKEMIFCGDTLFSAGCGRLFEGTPEQLYASLQKINQLDGSTLIYCAHEYTLSNLIFAQCVDPNNLTIKERIEIASAQEQKKAPSLPVSLDLERASNPFLRCDTDTIKKSVENHFQQTFESPVAVFTALRLWKDKF